MVNLIFSFIILSNEFHENLFFMSVGVSTLIQVDLPTQAEQFQFIFLSVQSVYKNYK